MLWARARVLWARARAYVGRGSRLNSSSRGDLVGIDRLYSTNYSIYISLQQGSWYSGVLIVRQVYVGYK